MTNPNIAEAGKKTRWKKGQNGNPNPEVRPWTYRHQLRWVMDQMLDYGSPEALEASIKKLMKCNMYAKKEHKVNAARLVAIRMFERAIKKMEPAMVVALIEQTEGKLPQVEIQASLEDMPVPTDFVSDEEAARIWQSTRAKQ